jgi:hypothetical protein
VTEWRLHWGDKEIDHIILKMRKYKKRRRNIFRRNQKIIEARKECWNVEERLELVEEV